MELGSEWTRFVYSVFLQYEDTNEKGGAIHEST
jgi:hypothetical protein